MICREKPFKNLKSYTDLLGYPNGKYIMKIMMEKNVKEWNVIKE